MSSEAYETFIVNLEYVDSIRIGSFTQIKGVQIGVMSNRGQHRSRQKRRKFQHAKGLNHVNQAASIILCGSWQQYIEDVVCLSRDAFIKSMSERLNPQQGQGVPGSSDAIWETAYQKYIKQAIDDFRTPTCTNINILLSQSIGVTCEVFSQSNPDGKNLDKLVKTRNKLAHRGVHGNPIIEPREVYEYMKITRRLATTTDNYLFTQLTKMHPNKISPWTSKAK